MPKVEQVKSLKEDHLKIIQYNLDLLKFHKTNKNKVMVSL